MTDCGLSDEEMGALQEAFPDVTFVWTLRIYVFFVPSDSDYFITNPDAGFKMNVHQQGPRGLYYLRSIRSLDLGHCHLSAVPFVANMPHLRHLILADDLVYDISPLENLKELEWARALQHRRTGPDAAARLHGAARSERMLHQHAAGRAF